MFFKEKKNLFLSAEIRIRQFQTTNQTTDMMVFYSFLPLSSPPQAKRQEYLKEEKLRQF